jgi:hypothetical protein
MSSLSAFTKDNITLRQNKGSALTHEEMDCNFTSYFYRVERSGSLLRFFRATSLDEYLDVPFEAPVGRNYSVQLKHGNAISGSDTYFTGSHDLRYDWDNGLLIVTGSGVFTQDVRVHGNIIVTGSVMAEQFITNTFSSSIQYSSGSNKFGDTLNDKHEFTGSVFVDRHLNVNGKQSVTGSYHQFGDIETIGNINRSGSIIHSGSYLLSGSGIHLGHLYHSGSTATSGSFNHLGTSKVVGTLTVSGSLYLTGSNTLEVDSTFIHTGSSFHKGDTNIDGNLVVTGRITGEEYHNEFVSSSIVYKSGSTQFGNSLDDTHIFSGSVDIHTSLRATSITSSQDFKVGGDMVVEGSLIAAGITSSAGLIVSGGTSITGDLNVTGDITGSDIQTTTYGSINDAITVVTASISSLTANVTNLTSATSSYVLNATTASFVTLSQTGSFITSQQTSSFVTTQQTSSFITTQQTSSFATSAETSVFATTGSNHFTGNQTITGSLAVTGDITAYASSDSRLKDNVSPIKSSLEKITQIGGYEFDWNSKSEYNGTHDVGVIAQEIEKVLPEVVVERSNGYKAVRYEKIVPLLIQSIKELKDEVEKLKRK